MVARRRHEREEPIADGVEMRCRYDAEQHLVSYAVVLLVQCDGRWRPVELFDCSHEGRNDRHRYGRDGRKGPAEPFHDGTPGEGYRAAIELIRTSWERMIERWQR